MSDQNKKFTVADALTVFRVIGCLGVVVLAVLQLVDVWEKSVYVSAPLTIVVLAVTALQEWKKRRGVAIFCLCAAIVLAIGTVVLYLI